MLGNIVSFILGTVLGVVLMCCFILAGAEDRQLEKLNRDNDSE